MFLAYDLLRRRTDTLPPAHVSFLYREYARMLYATASSILLHISMNRLCVLVVRVAGYRPGGPRFDSRRYQILWQAVGLERDPLSLVMINEELLERKSGDSCPENRD
jgi:hypothetical protein